MFVVTYRHTKRLMETKPPCILPFFRLHEDLTSGISIFLNLALFILILTRTSKEMRDYSKVMLYNCGLDFSFTVVTHVFDMVSSVGRRHKQEERTTQCGRPAS